MSITKSDTSKQAVSAQSLSPESKSEAGCERHLAAASGKKFKKKSTNNKLSVKPLAERPRGKSKSDDPFAWENYRTSDRRAIRLWGLLTDLVNDPMKIPMSEYLDMEISDVVRKDLEQLPQVIIKWLSNEP